MTTLTDRATPARGRAPRALWRPGLAAVCLALAAAATLPVRAQADSGAGTARVAVDAREAPRGIMSAHLVLPVTEGGGGLTGQRSTLGTGCPRSTTDHSTPVASSNSTNCAGVPGA